MEELLFWLPDSFMVIGIVVIAFGLMFGTISFRRAISLLGLVVLLLVSSPFVDALFDYLWRVTPIWLLVPAILLCFLAILRFLVRLVLGERATDEMVGNLAASVVRGIFRGLFRILTFPIRVLRAGNKVSRSL
jgi:hypothetical protein